ncbi:MAG: polyphosphate polymerase domain-containing protein [Deltaproteobacteria bacterium]|nr:polyphosphate polymerase domain-containing protein [Deltaproteobacteria bacterium]
MHGNEIETSITETDARLEIKFPLANRTSAGVDAAIRSHAMGFERLFPTRWIHNIYFDTPALSCFYTSMSGATQRLKLRLRWYGDPAGPDSGALEWKWRRSALGRKWVAPVDWEGNLEKQCWSALRTGFREDLGARQRASFDALALPTLLNRYRREYWISRDESIRLTVDDQLSFVPQRSSLAPQMRGSIPWGRMRVLEIKAPATSMKSVREAARGFPYRPARFSKYTAGMELSLPHRVSA